MTMANNGEGVCFSTGDRIKRVQFAQIRGLGDRYRLLDGEIGWARNEVTFKAIIVVFR